MTGRHTDGARSDQADLDRIVDQLPPLVGLFLAIDDLNGDADGPTEPIAESGVAATVRLYDGTEVYANAAPRALLETGAIPVPIDGAFVARTSSCPPLPMSTDTERLNLLIGLRRYADAEKAARDAIGRDPNWGPGYTHLARVLINLNRADEAIAAAREGVRKMPKDAWALGTLACALNWFNRTKEALAAAEQAIRIDPTYSWSYAMLANILYNLKRLEKAHQAAIDGLKYEPDSESLLRWKGWAEHGLKRNAEALATAEAGLVRHPNSHLLSNLLGRVKWTLAESKSLRRRMALHREADAALAEAARLHPTEPTYRTSLRDNAASARSYILQMLLPLAGLLVAAVPAALFAAFTSHLHADKSFLLPLVFACLLVLATRISQVGTAAALIAPLDRFGPPTAPIDDRDRRQGRAEWAGYLVFFLAPHGAMLWAMAKVWGL